MSGEHCHHDIRANRRILWTVLALNLVMFFVEVWQGLSASSSALLADSMDFFSDSFSYGVTLYVLTHALHVRARAALLKAGLMLFIAACVLAQGIYNLTQQVTPEFHIMGWIGMLALFINLLCAFLLYKSRNRDSNMQSIWLCSRNDAIGNILIIIAAGLVYASGSLWPDLLAAVFIAGLGASSALKIIAQAKKELHHD